MKKIKIEAELEIIRTGYMQVFCKKVNSKTFIIGLNPEQDVIIRLPDLAVTLDNPDEVIFKKGDKIRLTIEYVEKEKEK